MSTNSSLPSPSSASSFDSNSDVADIRDYLSSLPEEKTQTFFGRLWEKCKREPLVPIGAAATVAALTGGVIAFGYKQSALQQKFMQARVGAQAFTLGVMLIGFYQSGLLMSKPQREQWLKDKAAAAAAAAQRDE